MTNEENEAFIRGMRDHGITGEDGSVGLDRAFLLLDDVDKARGHVRLLGQALGLMLHKAGVVNPGMALTGPQLILAAEDYLGITIEAR